MLITKCLINPILRTPQQIMIHTIVNRLNLMIDENLNGRRSLQSTDVKQSYGERMYHSIGRVERWTVAHKTNNSQVQCWALIDYSQI